MLGLQRVLSLRSCQSLLNRNGSLNRNHLIASGFKPALLLCSAAANNSEASQRSAPLPGGQANNFEALIKQKFLAAASEITYHIEERSPDPTEAQILDLETKLEYSFKERQLLRLALTHKSAAAPSSTSLSWVGDACLQLIITEQLAAEEGYAPAGRLTGLRSLLASRDHFAECAISLGLEHMLVAGKGMIVERQIYNQLSAGVLGELFEAVLGAVFVDGGIVAARHAYTKNFPLEQELERMKKEKIEN
jgi:hypothetical protein